MRLIAPLTLLLWAIQVQATTTAATSPAVSPADELFADVDGVSERSLADSVPDIPGRLSRRACDYNGCKCNSRGNQITGCGNCKWRNNGEWLVTNKRVLTHIFECSPTGRCCDYGYAKDCGGSSARCIIN